MYVLQVYIRVKPERVEAFLNATRANAEASRREAGVARFDVIQQLDDPTRIVLIEAYRTPEGHAAHRETPHYATWRDAVNDMMAEPRTAVKFRNVSPADADW
jgi:(4S)-4-hydroxy-5-phosphonooxypentane-2,3-dione isomerase